MQIKLVLAATLVACSAAASASVEWRWTQHYFGPGPSGCVGQVVTTDDAGSCYVAGFSSAGVSLVKYDLKGSQVWESSYRTTSGWANGIALDPAGNVFVCGTALGTGTGMDIFLAKYSSQGKKVWSKTYNGPTNQNDYAAGMGIDASGNIYVAGTLANATALSDLALRKYDKNGGTEWTRTYNGHANAADVAKGVAVCPDGIAFLVGSEGVAGGGSTALSIRFDPNGNSSLLEIPQMGFINIAYAVAANSNGDVGVAVGFGPSNSTQDLLTLGFSHEGDPTWGDTFASPAGGNDQPVAIAFDRQGNCAVTATVFGGAASDDIETISYDSSGERNWEKLFTAPGQDNPTGLVFDALGNAYISGFTVGPDNTSDYLALKYSPAGTLEWARTYSGIFDGLDQAYGLAVDKWANVILVGGSFSPTGPFTYECATVKFIQPASLQPQALTLLRGVATSGGLSEVLGIDGQRLILLPGSVFSNQDWPGQIAFTTTPPDSSATEIRMQVVASASSSIITQNIDFYDFQAGVWRNQDSRSSSTTDSMVQVANSSDLARFYEPGTGLLKARLRYKASGVLFSYPWTARIDYVSWFTVH